MKVAERLKYFLVPKLSKYFLGCILPSQVSLQLGQSGQPLVSPDSPLPELLQGDGPSHGGLQGGNLSLVRLQLLPGGK